MLFNVEQDSGDRVTGYLVPDGFSNIAVYAVHSGDEELLRAETDEPREALVAAGRHETGICGFTIDESRIPGLAGYSDLEISAADTGIVFYRRFDPALAVQKRVFRLEAHLLPLLRLDRALKPSFQFCFPNIERVGLETSHQMFLMNNSDSIYVSGRVAYPGVSFYVEKGYEAIAIIQDPFVELAERILFLKAIARSNKSVLGERDNVSFHEAVAFADTTTFDDDRAVKLAFRTMPRQVAMMFSDPIVRQLTTRHADEPLTSASVSAALTLLSSFTVLGTRERTDLFIEGLGDHLGIAVSPETIPAQIPAALNLAGLLRRCPGAEQLIEQDLGLYHVVADALEKSLMGSKEGLA